MNSAPLPVFADWHPHFTPAWLSERLASHVPSRFVGAVIDPACGAGNLLAATAVRTGAAVRRPEEIHFVGTDVSKRAVEDCRQVLANLLPSGNFQVWQRNFLVSRCASPLEPSVIVMNPPFRGYGDLPEKQRLRIRSRLGMKGRFNLGHAFVSRAIRVYQPELLITLLPSHWVYSRTNWFREELRGLSGHWEWEDVGDAAFPRINVHLGILIWQRSQSRRSRTAKAACEDRLAEAGLEVRHGVATGSDETFRELAKLAKQFGSTREAVRGRDIGRLSTTQIWVPPRTWGTTELARFLNALPRTLRRRLRQRSCVRGRHRAVFEYHDAIPDWFTGVPKLLLPEIVTGSLRVELDCAGTKMPLHSVIAVRVPSIATGLAVLAFLNTAEAQRLLLFSAPRLNGGALRLQVGAVRETLNRWLPVNEG